MDDEKKYIYLDTAATASDSRFHVVDDFANPNAIHDAGREAYYILETARENLAKHIGAKRPGEVIFTSGATESNNIAIFGLARAAVESRKISCKPRVLISALEHESVIAPAEELKNFGFEVKTIPVDRNGFIDFQSYSKLCTDYTVLVSIQFANTEIGTIQNLKPLIDCAHKCGAVFHSDCVGAFSRTSLNVQNLGLDAASFSGHKIGTPKGIGMLYLKATVPCKPLLFGSGQEHGLRGGTQNVALARSLEMAANYMFTNFDKLTNHFLDLRNHLYHEIMKINGVRFTTGSLESPKDYLPNLVHLSFSKFTSETLILHYGKYDIVVSGGPACSSDKKQSSHVLRSIGIIEPEIDGAIRISFSESTTIKDLDKFIEATKDLLVK